ncbi:MAG TPA: efflux RND transporter periplasmic adaptor subunit [Planctomycetota bacterium]|nr:efflux RND transporter periplasmic adaptor subunit [Planctomycetota bacterium]
MRRSTPLAPVVACCLFAAAVGCGKEEVKAPEKPPAEVYVVKVEAKDVPVSFQYVAQTESSHEVEIRARVIGFLDKRVYTEGAMVKAGDVLFQMDPKPFQAQVDDFAAALARHKAALETARLSLARVKPLVEQDALSKKQLDDATGLYETFAAAVEQAKAQLTQAQLNLSYCTITSPVDGAAGAAILKDGAYVSLLNNHLTTVSTLTPIWVNFSISEQWIQNLRNEIAKKSILPPADEAYEVEIIQVDGTTFPKRGHITFKSPIYNPQTGTFLIRVTLENPGGVLRPNQYVQARIHGSVRPKAVLVPQRAVQQGAKGHFVWVVSPDSKAENRPVAVGDWLGDDWFINEGLKAGEDVVVDGGLALQPGAPVSAKPLSAKAEKASKAPEGEPKDKPAKKGD